MPELDFKLDNVSASTRGIIQRSQLTVSPAVPRVQSIQIAGRSGDLHIDEGAYNNRVGTIPCYALDSTFTQGVPNAKVMTKMDTVMAFLFRQSGYRKLQVSDDTDHYWYGRVANGGEISARLSLLNPFSIEFDLKPFRYLVGGETIVPNVTSLTEFENLTGFNAYPLIYVSATGQGTIENSYGSVTILDSTSEIIIDTEDCRAYSSGGASKDYLISSDAFPYLPPGSGGFTISNTLTVRVSPRYRTL